MSCATGVNRRADVACTVIVSAPDEYSSYASGEDRLGKIGCGV